MAANAHNILKTGPFLDLGAAPLSVCHLAEKDFCPHKFKVRKGLMCIFQDASQCGSYSLNDLTCGLMVHRLTFGFMVHGLTFGLKVDTNRATDHSHVTDA